MDCRSANCALRPASCLGPRRLAAQLRALYASQRRVVCKPIGSAWAPTAASTLLEQAASARSGPYAVVHDSGHCTTRGASGCRRLLWRAARGTSRLTRSHASRDADAVGASALRCSRVLTLRQGGRGRPGLRWRRRRGCGCTRDECRRAQHSTSLCTFRITPRAPLQGRGARRATRFSLDLTRAAAAGCFLT